MNYGLYLSATGVVANSYRQDVLANNLANTETVGFKRDVALFRERLNEAKERGGLGRFAGESLYDKVTGGLLAQPTLADQRQGDLEPTENDLDLGLQGEGWFAVKDGDTTRLTRDGRFMIDRDGRVVLGSDVHQQLVDSKGLPIVIHTTGRPEVTDEGNLTVDHQLIAKIGVFDVADRSKLAKEGGNLLTAGNEPLQAGTGQIRSRFIERSNVDPATELAELMETQRQLEASANMIRLQDQTLARLVNDVGKIG